MRCRSEDAASAHNTSRASPAALGVEFCEGGRKPVEGSAEQRDVVGPFEVGGEGNLGRETLEVLGEDLATTAAAFDVLEGVEAAFDRVIGPVDHAHPSRAHPDRVTRERGAVLLQMGEDNVDRIALVDRRSPFRAPSAEQGAELVEGDADGVEFGDGGNSRRTLGRGAGRAVGLDVVEA